MKNISILTLLFFLTTLVSFSQEIVPIEEQFNYEYEGGSYYLKDINYLLDKFTGEWEYTDNTHYFKIKFYKIEGINRSFSPKETYDEIRSFILYKEKQGTDWVVIYNTYPISYTIADLNNQNFNDDYGIKGNLIVTNNNKLELTYYEPAPLCTSQSRCIIVLNYLNSSNNPQLQWSFDPCIGTIETGPCSLSGIYPTYNHRIPIQMVLNKL